MNLLSVRIIGFPVTIQSGVACYGYDDLLDFLWRVCVNVSLTHPETYIDIFWKDWWILFEQGVCLLRRDKSQEKCIAYCDGFAHVSAPWHEKSGDIFN